MSVTKYMPVLFKTLYTSIVLAATDPFEIQNVELI